MWWKSDHQARRMSFRAWIIYRLLICSVFVSFFGLNMSLTVVDLFAGAGGLSCGFVKAGFDVSLAVEQDLWASETYLLNHQDTKLLVQDIRSVEDSQLLAFKGADVVIGGPPCQGFSISASHRRNPDDPRNFLYLEFLRVVGLIKPRAVLMENVREITRFKLPDGRSLCGDIQERLTALGYHSEILILNAAAFGVPQARIRTFILAVPSANELRRASHELLVQSTSVVDIGEPGRVISLWDAISDLPPVEPHKVPEDAVLEYARCEPNAYQSTLRTGSAGVYNHVPMRHTPRMIERFRHLIENCDQGCTALPNHLTPRARSNPEIASGKTYDQNHRRLEPSKPSPTITASFYSSFIHPFQARNLTVREAARLQSFPDSYIFRGKRTTLSKKLLARKGVFGDLYLDQFNQVGNSVPPLLATQLAKIIKGVITK